MIGSHKLFLDIEVPIQNVIVDKINKVFKLVEIEKSEIDKFSGKVSKKTFYNNLVTKKKKHKGWVGLQKKTKPNIKGGKDKISEKNMKFVHGTSSEEEKEI
ncbi:hypothetical protein Hanom_Chr09g00800031 [Helianthus anomalus]